MSTGPRPDSESVPHLVNSQDFHLPPEAVRTSGAAVASLIVGLLALGTCFVPVIPGAVATGLGWYAITRTGPMKRPGRELAMAGFVLGLISLTLSLLMLPLLLPAMRSLRAAGHVNTCQQHLQSIGHAARQYAEDDPLGRFPDNLRLLLDRSGLGANRVICPGGNERPPRPGERLVWMQNVSYVWMGEDVTQRSSPAQVLAYELVDNHRRDGAHFLFADGTVVFHPRELARAWTQQLELGINPPDPDAATTQPSYPQED